MAIPKVCGIETEYGIQAVNLPESNPIAASSILVNAYVAQAQKKVGWDFEDESPGRDARGFAREGAMPPEIETNLANAVLTNGARFYVDHAHPELSTPECATARELVLWDKAGERILALAMAAASRVLGPDQEIVVYKNNSDGKGNSYGCHENYLMDRSVPFSRIVQQVTPHFVTRQIYTGAGKVGAETIGPQGARGPVTFQISQRADFFEEPVGLETTLKRPIVNTRDEPHADPRRYRRLHVIVGDANLAEVATFLKVGTTALVLSMVEDDFFAKSDLSIALPVRAIHQVSRDLSLEEPIEMADGGTMTAVDVQWEMLALARKYAQSRGMDCVGGADAGEELLERWEAVLEGLEGDREDLARSLDWVAKYRVIDAYRERHGLDWADRKLAALDLTYHDVRPARSLFSRLDMERLTTDDEVALAVTEPPGSTRAYFRGRCLQRWASSVAAANWDSLVFDLGSDPLRRIPMMDPLKGTAAHVATLFDECETPAELLARLGA